MNNQNFQKILIKIFIITVFFFLGFYLGDSGFASIGKAESIINKEIPSNLSLDKNVDFDLFWKSWKILQKKHPDFEKITDQERVWGAINGLAQSLGDPYTNFLSPEELNILTENLNGKFGGVGIEVGVKDGILTVIAPLKGTPAEKVGIKSGDQIIKINGELTEAMSLEKAISSIRGKAGTKVKLTIIRENISQPLEFEIKREIIELPVIETEVKPNGIFVIKIYTFANNTEKLFKKALLEIIKTKPKGLILDLRNNPGGILDTAIEIASWFLPKDKIIVIEDFGPGKKQRINYSKGYDLFSKEFKIVVLINGGSASASEIVAGALKDNQRAIIVGENSFGKGSVQELVPLTYNPDTALKITIARWLTPSGISISEEGIKPNIEVKITEDDIKNKKDPQLEKAMEIILNKVQL